MSMSGLCKKKKKKNNVMLSFRPDDFLFLSISVLLTEKYIYHLFTWLKNMLHRMYEKSLSLANESLFLHLV